MSQSKPNFYAIIPAPVRYNKNLPMGAILLYGEITALSNAEGYCWASNAWFADNFNVSKRTVQNWLRALETELLICIDQSGFDGNTQRKITPLIEANWTPGKKVIHRKRG